MATASSSLVVGYILIIGGVVIALEGDTVRPAYIHHDLVPRFTTSTSEQSQESVDEVLEIRMVVQLALAVNLYKTEQLNPNNRE